MKKLLLFGVVFSLAVWLACSSNNPTDSGNGGPAGPQRVVANKAVGAPSMTNANDAVWNSVTNNPVDISTANSPKLPAPESQNAPDSIYFKAIVAADTLYLRIEYRNDSLNLLRDFLETVDNNTNFEIRGYSQEDQLFVMFAGLPNNAYDVWNWRSLTTAPAGLAEGCRYEGGALITDSGGQQVGFVNNTGGGFTHPQYVHSTGASFTGQILLKKEMESFASHQSEFLFPNLVVPGWYVDDSVGYYVKQPAYKQSRWDIFTVHNYNSSTNRLAVVLQCALNTGRSDDLAMADSVKMKIGVLDDQSDIAVQGSRRGFSQEFWLIL